MPLEKLQGEMQQRAHEIMRHHISHMYVTFEDRVLSNSDMVSSMKRNHSRQKEETDTQQHEPQHGPEQDEVLTV